MVLKKFLNFFRSDFNKNFMVLFTGSSVAQLIPIVASLILVRFYTPDDFGILALFNGMVGVFTPVSTLKYEFAIPLPNKVRDSIVLVISSALISLIFSITLLIVFIFFKSDILFFFNAEALGVWVYLIPLSVFLGGIYSSLNYFNIRFKKYKIIAGSNIIRSLVSSSVQIFLGVIKMGYSGLLLGNIISLVSGNSKMIYFFRKFLKKTATIKIIEIYKNLKIYSNFPLISMWGVLLNNLSLNINNFFISGYYGLSFLGHYSYGYKNLSLPLSVISSNVGQVFYQKCIELNNNKKSCRNLFIGVFVKIIIVTGPLFLFLYFFIEELFAFFFGEEWRIAGFYSKILLPVFFIRSIFSPLSMLTMALEKQKLMLYMQISFFITNLISFLITFINSWSIDLFLVFYSVFSSLVYSFCIYILYSLSKLNS